MSAVKFTYDLTACQALSPTLILLSLHPSCKAGRTGVISPILKVTTTGSTINDLTKIKFWGPQLDFSFLIKNPAAVFPIMTNILSKDQSQKEQHTLLKCPMPFWAPWMSAFLGWIFKYLKWLKFVLFFFFCKYHLVFVNKQWPLTVSFWNVTFKRDELLFVLKHPNLIQDTDV